MDAIYSAEQIEVPAALPALLKAYTKEVIRNNPANIPAFSRDYFTALADGELPSFLDKCAAARAEAQKKSEQPKTETVTATEAKTVTAAETTISA